VKWQVDIYGWYALAYGKTVFRPANLRTTRRRTPAVSNSFMNEARMKPRLQTTQYWTSSMNGDWSAIQELAFWLGDFRRPFFRVHSNSVVGQTITFSGRIPRQIVNPPRNAAQ
jgi:hypothetical protein